MKGIYLDIYNKYYYLYLKFIDHILFANSRCPLVLWQKS